MKYYYPKNLISKPRLALWHVKDVFFGSIFALGSFFIISKTGISLPLIFTIVYMVLKIRPEEYSIYEGLLRIIKFLIRQRVFFNTKANRERENEKENSI